MKSASAYYGMTELKMDPTYCHVREFHVYMSTSPLLSPDEWATTKQACRDELVVYCFFFSSIYTSLYFYVFITVLRKSNFTIQQCVTVHPVPKFRSCHKAIMVTTRRAHCIHIVYYAHCSYSLSTLWIGWRAS